MIPAFCKRGDVIVMDEACNYAIQSGTLLSRSRVYRFRHNDMDSLEQTLRQIDAEDLAAKRPLTRRFILVEGIYAHLGDLCPLDKVFALKQRYQYRLLVDETMSLGVLGRTGRGACEHYGIDPSDVDVIVASMSTSLATVGGKSCQQGGIAS